MKRKQGFLFDYNFCIGCKACEISCQVYHNQDPDINWRHVDMILIHEDEIEKEIFISHSCHHCEEPACMDVCPVGAYIKLENGVVQPLHDKCIGCGYCLVACPYGSITKGKDGRMNIEIKVNNREDRYAYHLEVYDNGHAYIDVSADERDRIGFAGMMNVGR